MHSVGLLLLPLPSCSISQTVISTVQYVACDARHANLSRSVSAPCHPFASVWSAWHTQMLTAGAEQQSPTCVAWQPESQLIQLARLLCGKGTPRISQLWHQRSEHCRAIRRGVSQHCDGQRRKLTHSCLCSKRALSCSRCVGQETLTAWNAGAPPALMQYHKFLCLNATQDDFAAADKSLDAAEAALQDHDHHDSFPFQSAACLVMRASILLQQHMQRQQHQCSGTGNVNGVRFWGCNVEQAEAAQPTAALKGMPAANMSAAGLHNPAQH